MSNVIPMPMPLLAAKDLVKTYALGDVELHALDHVSLSVTAGECVAIMGTSGSGKSTLMNILGCLDRPTSGSYLLDGREVQNLSKAELAEVRNKTIGFVFQSFNLLARTSALENVELPLLYSDVSRKERRARAIEALIRVGLGERLDHHPAQLSGGQQQRVAIARAIVTRPKVVLADEPTGNLDSRTRLGVMALFQELWRAGLTILFVTHDAEVARYASRLVELRDGRIVSGVDQEARTAAQDYQEALAA